LSHSGARARIVLALVTFATLTQYEVVGPQEGRR
jgi:hypothetical protein